MNSLPSPKYHDLREGEQKHAVVAGTDALAPYDDYEEDYDDGDAQAWGDDVVMDPSLLTRRASRAKRIRAAASSVRSLVDTALLVVILWLLVDRTRRDNRDGSDRLEMTGDLTGFAPRCASPTTQP